MSSFMRTMSHCMSCTCGREHAHPSCLLDCPSISSTGYPSSGWGVLVIFKPLPTSCQHCICLLDLYKIHHVHRCQLCSLQPCLIFQTHLLTQQFLVSFNLTPVYNTYNGTLQQGADCLTVMADWDSTEGISHPTVHPFLVFQGKLK